MKVIKKDGTIEQFRKKYGIIENVSDRPYVSNSFHCHVTEDLTPIEKQNLEGRFWDCLLYTSDAADD